MPLTQKDIDEFKSIYARVFGEVPTNDQAWDMAKRMIRLFDVLTRAPGASPLDIEDERFTQKQ